MAKLYDVFLSVKNLGPDGKPTRDSILAKDIYYYLRARQLSVFLAAFELEVQGVSAYKKAIDAALDSSQVLIAVGTSCENLESDWVRYEWDGFFNDIISMVKPQGRVFSYIEGVDFKSLPRALRQSQAIAHGDGSLDALYRFLTNALGVEPVKPASSPPQEPSRAGPPPVAPQRRAPAPADDGLLASLDSAIGQKPVRPSPTVKPAPPPPPAKPAKPASLDDDLLASLDSAISQTTPRPPAAVKPAPPPPPAKPAKPANLDDDLLASIDSALKQTPAKPSAVVKPTPPPPPAKPAKPATLDDDLLASIDSALGQTPPRPAAPVKPPAKPAPNSSAKDDILQQLDDLL